MYLSEIYDYNISNWKYAASYDEYGNLIKLNYTDSIDSSELIDDISIVKINEININSPSNTPLELLTYNLNIQNIPKVMNIMAKQSSYGLHKLVVIKSTFNDSEIKDGVVIDRSGSIVKFYIPKSYVYNKNYITSNICTIKILNMYKDISNPLAIIKSYTSIEDDVAKDQFNKTYNENVSSGISELTHDRVFTLVISSENDANKVAQVTSHLDQKFNEHQGQSSIVFSDLREGTFPSKLLLSLISTDVRLSCINGVAIAGDFTKYFLGTHTQDFVNNLVTSVTREDILTSNGENIIYN